MVWLLSGLLVVIRYAFNGLYAARYDPKSLLVAGESGRLRRNARKFSWAGWSSMGRKYSK